ncbi:MAG: magnesium/cobalt efflux protein, partial [Pseudomonadales bacterium]|nr:magnesium/cobalt efflux protein [Pseudomonadales bacterium]
MSDDRNADEHDERSWLEKIAQVFSSDPRTRKDLLDILVIAEQNDVIDTETHGIMQGALEVAHLQVRDVMIPRPQMVCLHSDET